MWSNRMYTYPVREAFRFHFNEATAAPVTHEENKQAYTYRPAERRRDTLDLRPFMSERGALEHAMAKDLIRREAPFGTLDTPNITMKIVGGVRKPVLEIPVQHNDQFVQGSRLQAIQQVSDKPNHLDPRTFGDNPGVYYNKDAQQQESLRPTTLVNKRPDSKDVARQQYHPLPAIQANRTRNDMSTVFEAEQWTDNRHPSLAQETEYKQNYMLGDEEQSRMDNLFGSSGEHQHDSLHVSDQERDNLFMLVPRNVLLPVDAIKLSRQQEETLCKLICSELKDFDEKELRDVYVECSQHDKELRGFCGIEVLDNCLRRHRACLSDSLRLTGAQFVDHNNPGKVNYEKILSFIGSALKMKTRDQFKSSKKRSQVSSNSRVSSVRTPRSKGNKYYMMNGEPMKTGSIYRDREVAKLLRMVEQELSNNSYFMDFTKWNTCFCERDRDYRNTLSSSQIKDVCYDQRLPLSDSLINHILSLCEDNNRDGQYKWNAFLEFLNRVRPSNTGLPIPQQRQSSPRRQYDTGRRDRSPSKDVEQTRDRYSPDRNNRHSRSRERTPLQRQQRDCSPPRDDFNSPTQTDERYNERRGHRHKHDQNGYDGRQDRERWFDHRYRQDQKGYDRSQDHEQWFDRYSSPDRDEQSGYQPSWQQHNSPRRSTSPPPARRINERVPDPRDRNNDPRHRGRETFRDQGQSYRDQGQESYRDHGHESYRDHGHESHRDEGRSSQEMNRDDQIRQLSNQLKHLESKYHVTRDGMHSHELSWLDRFLKMAKALYNSDVSNRGSLPRKDVMEIVRQYNDAFSLDLDMTRANMVAISPENLDKSGNIILRPFLANLTGNSGITKKSYH